MKTTYDVIDGNGNPISRGGVFPEKLKLRVKEWARDYKDHNPPLYKLPFKLIKIERTVVETFE